MLADVLVEEVLEFLSPATCAGCSRLGTWFCRTCNLALSPIEQLVCPGCLTPEPKGSICKECQVLEVPLDQLIPCCAYESRMFHRILAAYKEDGNAHLHVPLGQRLVRSARSILPRDATPVVVPIPCTKKRARARGFDQSKLLARYVARRLGLPLACDVLVRQKHRGSQKGLGVFERRRALRDAYRIAADSQMITRCKAQGVLLIDDVATSLATLETCALLLRDAGAPSVRAIVLAHAALT